MIPFLEPPPGVWLGSKAYMAWMLTLSCTCGKAERDAAEAAIRDALPVEDVLAALKARHGG